MEIRFISAYLVATNIELLSLIGDRKLIQIMSIEKGTASKWLYKNAAIAKNYYILASLFTLLSAGCFVFFSWFISDFAATWLVKGEVYFVTLEYAFVFIVGRYLFAYFAQVINYKAGLIIVSKIKTKLYPQLLNNNQTDSISSTLLVTRVCDDLKPFFAFFIPYATASVLVGLLLLIVTLFFEKWVGIVLLITFVIIPLQMVMIGMGAESLHKKHINLFMKYSSVYYNRLQTIAEIVNLNNLNPQYLFLSEKSKSLNDATINVMRVAVLSSAILELFVTIAIASVAVYMGVSLLGLLPGSNYGRGYDFQTALFMLMLTPYFFFYLRKFVSAYHDRNKALASASLIMPFLDSRVEAPNSDITESLSSIEITNLSFAYPNTMVKVLNNICLKFPLTGVVLVKGISGSGKSTLLKILSGNLSIDDGLVSLNGKDNNHSAKWLRVNSSYMNQYPFVFDGTLRYNIFLEKELSENMQLPDFVNKIVAKKEDGLDTLLSHNGKQLSGGEKQLVTLARMLLYPKPIAILDEPTANLDADTVELILEQIKDLAKSRLVIIASHEEKFDSLATTTLHLNWGEQMNYE